MKKTIFITLFIFLIVVSTTIYSTSATPNNGYSFEIKYEGEVKKDVPKNATVTLKGTNATPYEKVNVKVENISAPATPKVLATDEHGQTFDISQSGQWGPISGFAVGGTFENVTPVTITYPKAGTYVSRISLVDLNNDNAVITSKEFTVVVTEDPVIENNVVNNTVEEIPQTGVSIWTYIAVAVLVIAVILLIRKVTNKNK